MPLVDSPVVQARASDMLMHNETLHTAVEAASTPVHNAKLRPRASCPTATGLSRLHAHWSAGRSFRE
eukprot:351624-Prymnesium_polylepis.1